MEKKITKKEMFAQIIANYALTAEEKAFMEHEIELLNRKGSKDRKPTAKQLANEEMKSAIFNLMNPNQLYTCTELSKVLQPNYEENISTNKISALLRQMIENGTVVKTTEKRKSYFQKVVEG